MPDYSKWIYFTSHNNTTSSNKYYNNRPATSKIENEDIRKYVDKYLDIGEWVVDSSVVFMNNSPYFERKR